MAGNLGKLTPDRRMVLIDGKRVGLSNAMCAARAGISESILYKWIQDARGHRETGRKPLPWDRDAKNWKDRTSPRESKELELLEAMERAEGDRLAEALLHIREAAKGGAVTERVTTTTTGPDGAAQTTTREKVAQPDWKAAAWLAERTRRQDYGVTRTEVTGADGGPVQVSTWADVVRRAAEEEAELESAERKKKGGG